MAFAIPDAKASEPPIMRSAAVRREREEDWPGVSPAHGHQMHELGSIDVMRLHRRSAVASRCPRIKLYVDENFP